MDNFGEQTTERTNKHANVAVSIITIIPIINVSCHCVRVFFGLQMYSRQSETEDSLCFNYLRNSSQ